MEEAQKDHQRKLVGGGTDHARANAEVWTRKFLILGDALQAYDFARRQQIAPLLLLDEFEKTRPAVEYYFYQLFTDGGINVPRLTEDEGTWTARSGRPGVRQCFQSSSSLDWMREVAAAPLPCNSLTPRRRSRKISCAHRVSDAPQTWSSGVK